MKRSILTSLLCCAALSVPAFGDGAADKTCTFTPVKSEPFASRASAEKLTDAEIPAQTLANLLWAANGVNRDNGKRTAPSAMNQQEVGIFVFTPKGVFSTDIGEKAVSLTKVSDKDLRADVVGGQADKFGAAPVMLLLVADSGKFAGMDDKRALVAVSIDTGAVMQNILLFCNANGLEARPRMWMDAEKLAKELSLPPEKLLLLNIVVGAKVPAKSAE